MKSDPHSDRSSSKTQTVSFDWDREKSSQCRESASANTSLPLSLDFENHLPVPTHAITCSIVKDSISGWSVGQLAWHSSNHVQRSAALLGLASHLPTGPHRRHWKVKTRQDPQWEWSLAASQQIQI